MPRNPSHKIIRSDPPARRFEPSERKSASRHSVVNLLLEEWEAMRLVDYAGMEQSQAALSMGVSRQSVQMLVSSARTKLARAVVEGLPLQIIGEQQKNLNTDLRNEERERKMKIAVTAQNHGYAVDGEKVPEGWMVTHRSVNDDTIEGLRHKTLPIFSVQYHPEAQAGPQDTEYLFDQFVQMMEKEASKCLK